MDPTKQPRSAASWAAEAHQLIFVAEGLFLVDTLYEFVHQYHRVPRRHVRPLQLALAAAGYQTLCRWHLFGTTVTAIMHEQPDPNHAGRLESFFTELLDLATDHRAQYGGWRMAAVRRWHRHYRPSL